MQRTLIQNVFRIIPTLIMLALVVTPSVCWASPSQSFNNAKSQSSQDKFVTVNGVRLHYVQQGNGVPVVLLHGNDGTLQDFTYSIFDRLSTKYRTIAFDRPGHGQSQVPAKVVPIPEVQAMLFHSALCKLGLSKPILVAHSWSGSVALSYALLFPNELSGMVLLSPQAYETGNVFPKVAFHALQLPILGTAIAFYYKMTYRDQVRKQLEQAFLPGPTPKVYEDKFLSSLFRTSQIKAAACDEITINRCFKRISPYYNRIKIPVIIVSGERDKTVTPSKNSYPLHKAIQQSQLVTIPQAGHELQFTQSQEVLDAIDVVAKITSGDNRISVLPSNTKPLIFNQDLSLPKNLNIKEFEDWQNF